MSKIGMTVGSEMFCLYSVGFMWVCVDLVIFILTSVLLCNN